MFLFLFQPDFGIIPIGLLDMKRDVVKIREVDRLPTRSDLLVRVLGGLTFTMDI